MHLIVDTREKRPVRFTGHRVTRKALKVGDYTIYGYGKVIAVERKSLTDFLICISTKRDHFARQLRALRKINYSIVVVEGRLDQKSFYSSIDVKVRAAIVAKILVTYKVPIVFASNRTMTALTILNYLKYAKANIDIGII